MEMMSLEPYRSGLASIASDGGLTILSMGIAFLAVFLTLELVVRTTAGQAIRWKNGKFYAGSLVFGLGLWTIHRVSLSLHVPNLFDSDHFWHDDSFWVLLVPLVATLGTSLLTMKMLALSPITLKHRIGVCLVLGLGMPIVVLMSLFSPHVEGSESISLFKMACAFVVTVLSSYLALYLVFEFTPRYRASIFKRFFLAASLLTVGLTFSCALYFEAVLTLNPSVQVAVVNEINHAEMTAILTIVLLIVSIVNYWHISQERIHLEKSLLDLHLAQEIAHMGSWDWNLETEKMTWSVRLANIFGVGSVCDHVGVGVINKVIHVGDRVDVLQCRRQARQDPQGQWSIRYRITRPDGEVRMVREHGRTLTDKDQKPIRLLATVADVTHIYDMEKREERVIQSQIALSALLETGLESMSLDKQLQTALHIILTVPWLSIQYQGSIFLVDSESGDLVLASHVGMSPDQIRVCARVRSGHCLCGQALEKREIVFASNVDFRHEISYPEMLPHGHYCVPILFRNRGLGVLNLYVPHGYAKNAEEDAFLTTISNTLAGLIDHRLTEAKLRNEQEFIATILRTAPSLVVVLDQEGQVILFNHACQLLTGYTEAEVIGRGIGALLPSDEVDTFGQKLRQLAPGEKPLDYEGHWLTKGGESRLIAWSSTATVQGDKRHIIGTGVDISEKRQAEHRLQFMASHDLLTGLPNRMQFMEHLVVGIAQAR
ncbi:MAG TPA: PAS domain S-box protein, partial [Magnetococcales bacterium]|nr:PAS domain S-box protein [Magnetococcales bacterium]